MKNYLKNVWIKLVALFKQGLSPKLLALSIAVSMVVSMFPIFGITTLVLACIAIPLKLNLPIMIVLSYVFEPLKLFLLIPFINIGAKIFGAKHTLLTYEAIKTSYEFDFFGTTRSLAYELICGFGGWVIIALPVSILFYLLLKMLFSKFLTH